jgi:Domain of unknown function (DUF4381)
MSPLAAAPSPPAGGDPLAALRGIHLPEPIGLWPPAPGWWLLLALVAAASVLVLVAVRRYRASVARRAIGELDALAAQPIDLQTLATAVSVLLRRVALLRFGRTAARLHGTGWQDFLAAHAPRGPHGRTGSALSTDLGRALALAPYAPPGALDAPAGRANVDRQALLTAARAWIRGNL